MSSVEQALLGLRHHLRAAGYEDFLAMYGWSSPRHSARAFDRLLAPTKISDLIGFCEFGEAVSPEQLGLSATACNELVSLNIFENVNGKFSLKRLRIISHFGLLILSGQRGIHELAYHGEDSLALGRHLSHAFPGTDVLDLCGGVGTQGLLAAARGANVVSVDINPNLALLQWANSKFNPVAGSVIFRQGNLFEPVFGQQFDAIYANPPLIPVSNGRTIGLHCDGGETGLNIVNAIASKAATYLRPNGRLFIQGLAFGDTEQPAMSTALNALVNDGLSVTLTCIYRENIADDGPILTALYQTLSESSGGEVSEIRQEYADISKRLGVTHLFSWQLGATMDGHGKVDLMPIFRRNALLWNC